MRPVEAGGVLDSAALSLFPSLSDPLSLHTGLSLQRHRKIHQIIIPILMSRFKTINSDFSLSVDRQGADNVRFLVKTAEQIKIHETERKPLTGYS